VDAIRWAEQARRAFPNDFGMALLGIALYTPSRQLELLLELLNQESARPHPDDFAAVGAFAHLAHEAIKTTGATAAAADVLRRACEIFPDSPRLADMMGRLLRVMGNFEESSAQYRRALSLRRIARAYHADFPREDGAHYYWQFAEHIQQVRNPEK